MDELRSAGRILAIGADVNIWQICERLLGEADFDGFLFAGCYMLLEQELLETFLPLLLKRVVGVILGFPYNLGIFATGAVDGGLYDYALAPEAILQRLKNLSAVCTAHKTPLIAVALKLPLGNEAVKFVILGAPFANKVHENIEVLKLSIPPALRFVRKSNSLICTDAPIPKE